VGERSREMSGGNGSLLDATRAICIANLNFTYLLAPPFFGASETSLDESSDDESL